MTEEKIKKMKSLMIRLTENLWTKLKAQAEKNRVSVNRLIHLILTTSLEEKDILFDEQIGKLEKKEIESRVHFTASEAEVLKRYALSNGWSLSQEIWYRVVSSFAKKPKLSGEELKAIYSVRSSINVLGANINRLIRNHEILSDDNIKVCCELTLLIKELQDKINYLEKCSYSRFKLKGVGGRDGR